MTKPIKKPTKAKTNGERQRRRRARLDALALGNGFDSWTKLETAMLAGTVVVLRLTPPNKMTGATTGAGQG